MTYGNTLIVLVDLLQSEKPVSWCHRHCGLCVGDHVKLALSAKARPTV